ncbi:hypothetical protein J6590_060989 [Homalodisca vitripennis]|nr:hypothetical protein J6590_060989 [Homalodisca vitripennis]
MTEHRNMREQRDIDRPATSTDSSHNAKRVCVFVSCQARHTVTVSASHTPTVSVTTIVFSPPQYEGTERY